MNREISYWINVVRCFFRNIYLWWKNIPWRVKASRIRVEIHPNFGEFGVYIDRDEAP